MMLWVSTIWAKCTRRGQGGSAGVKRQRANSPVGKGLARVVKSDGVADSQRLDMSDS